MLNLFFATHPQLILTPNTRENLTEKTVRRAKWLARQTVSLPESLAHAEGADHTDWISRACEWEIMKIIDEPSMYLSSSPGILLLEVVGLHKLQMLAETEAQKSRAYVVLGSMIQSRLTQIFLRLYDAHEHIKDVFAFGAIMGIDQEHWEADCSGAFSCARAAAILCKTHDCRVYLANIKEDIGLGIDLIALTRSNAGVAISVKTTHPTSTFWIEHVHTQPKPEDVQLKDRRRRRIFTGTQKFNERNTMSTNAVCILIPKFLDSPYTIDPSLQEVVRCKNFFRYGLTSNTTQPHLTSGL
ncbi:hypothetical protein A2318_02610 [Candidatus Uhrbacteria bacterium RIFOXYB2_FULL_45_11]|uniref:Uncharacterized protein n=1 Tax=Candidatus Uhrbacteria bacterium RIFOXYB2_FULL_45_11 TaxID=1802421 RepID=A0A1F7W2X9_9BACT|nr:MAG: hypothetical protein A2318_02610 [Candidatus Uhrbacteria bacterium RIFOXYB2_FULL_45_11]